MRPKTVYKLFRQRKDGTLGPLFIDRAQRIPLGEWLPAFDIPTKGYAHRPGWHAGTSPVAAHLTERDRVWCECSIAGDELTPEANPNLFRPAGDMGVVPGGWYRWKRPAHQGGEWVIAGALRVDRVLTPGEVQALRTI
jgi:hypothetical protein